MENCHQMSGTAVESLATSAAVEILTADSQAAGLAGRASVGRDFEIWEAEENAPDEGPLHDRESKFNLLWEYMWLCT